MRLRLVANFILLVAVVLLNNCGGGSNSEEPGTLATGESGHKVRLIMDGYSSRPASQFPVDAKPFILLL